MFLFIFDIHGRWDVHVANEAMSVLQLPQLRQSSPLPPLLVEIPVIKPPLKPPLDPLPVLIQHRKPRRIPTPPFDNHMLPEHALKHKPQSLRRLLRRHVQIIALPLIPAELEVLKNHFGKEVHCLRRHRGVRTQPNRLRQRGSGRRCASA